VLLYLLEQPAAAAAAHFDPLCFDSVVALRLA
jgi:hypothetical protein